MPGQFQHPNSVLGTDCTELKVIDPTGVESNLIIDTGSNFNVAARFVLGGALADGFHSAPTPESFTVTYYYEGMGGAADGVLGTATGTIADGVQIGVGPSLYEFKDPETRPAAPVTLPGPGIYRLSAVVTFSGMLSIYTAFCDGPLVRQN